MSINPKSTEPIYVQIAYWLENEILKGTFKEDEQVLSQYALADMFNINPATAAKGLTLIADEGIVYDRRGLGKFVSSNAKELIVKKRQKKTLEPLIRQITEEAFYLKVSEETLIKKIKQAYKKVGGFDE